MKNKNKRGDVTDIMVLVIVLFVLAIGFFIISYTIPYITNGLRLAHLDNTPEGANAINQLDFFGTHGIQAGFFWLFIGLSIATLISAFYVNTHPIWLFMYIIFLIISVIIGAYLANAYQSMTALDTFQGWSQYYMTAVMQNIVYIIIGVAALSFIIIFTKFLFMGSGGPTTL